jgi:hypothetical protein
MQILFENVSICVICSISAVCMFRNLVAEDRFLEITAGADQRGLPEGIVGGGGCQGPPAADAGGTQLTLQNSRE